MVTLYYQFRSITRKLIQEFKLHRALTENNVLIDWDTFLCSADQVNQLSFFIHFLGRNLTLGLTHTPSYSNHVETYLRNTTLAQLSL